MTSRLLSLVLPENSIWRYLRKGRKAIGFVGGTLVTREADGTTTGVSDLTATEATVALGTGVALATRFSLFSGRTAATAATIPAASGSLRHLIIQNANTSSGAVTITSPSTNIYTAASASASATAVIAIATVATFLSDGTNWYRVS
jgi:hypothetical protein